MAVATSQENPRTAFELYYTTIHNFVESSSSSSREEACRKLAHLLKLGSTERGDAILKWMFEKQVFSRIVLIKKFKLQENRAFSILRGLECEGLISVLGVLDSLGRKSPVYIVDGGDRDRLPDAVREHKFLYKDATPIRLEYANVEATYQEVVAAAIAGADQRSQFDHEISRETFMQLFKEKGVRSFGFSRVKALLEREGWRLRE